MDVRYRQISIKRSNFLVKKNGYCTLLLLWLNGCKFIKSFICIRQAWSLQLFHLHRLAAKNLGGAYKNAQRYTSPSSTPGGIQWLSFWPPRIILFRQEILNSRTDGEQLTLCPLAGEGGRCQDGETIVAIIHNGSCRDFEDSGFQSKKHLPITVTWSSIRRYYSQTSSCSGADFSVISLYLKCGNQP